MQNLVGCQLYVPLIFSNFIAMFTGIIEALGEVAYTKMENGLLHLGIHVPFQEALSVGQSIAHNGVCLTITKLQDTLYEVTAVPETLRLSSLGNLQKGDKINIERCLSANGRFDGHIVQGHIDLLAKCISVKEESGSYIFEFSYTESETQFVVKKGSIAVNGVSLTVMNEENNRFSVCIIPHTFENTQFQFIKLEDKVNVEFDLLGKYITRIMTKK